MIDNLQTLKYYLTNVVSAAVLVQNQDFTLECSLNDSHSRSLCSVQVHLGR